MRIGINLLPLRPGKNGGMEVYVRNLLEMLFVLDKTNIYYLVTAPYNDSSLIVPYPNCKKIVFTTENPISQKIIQSITQRIKKTSVSDAKPLEILIDKYQLDIWFCPFLSLDPRPLKIPSIVTIPDIQHEYCPEFFSTEELAMRKDYIQPSCEQATEIITISEYSKKCIIEKMGTNPEKIHVIYLAAGDLFSDIVYNENEVILKYHLPRDYFFYPANGWPHKNHLLLIMAFYLYRKSSNNNIHLILSGQGVKENQDIQNLIAQYNLQEYIHILDYVDKEDLPALFNNAKALVFPSLFEGFGIPLLEAMAMDCPIIASETTSIPEVAGDAAIFFDPKNPQSIADAMHQIIISESLRNSIIEKGKIRSREFSYRIVAKKHLDIFNLSHSKAITVKNSYLQREIVHFTGLYPDGWFTNLDFYYRGFQTFHAIRFDLIGILPVQYPLPIVVTINNKVKKTINIPSIGRYSFEMPIPVTSEKSPEIRIEFIPKKRYSPKKLGMNDDERKLSVLLAKFALVDQNDSENNFIEPR